MLKNSVHSQDSCNDLEFCYKWSCCVLNSQAPRVLSVWRFIKRETFQRPEISMIEKGMNKWMNKSCFAFLELSFLSSVQQIWKKQFFFRTGTWKKKKGDSPKSQWIQLLPQETLWNWSSVLSHNYKHFLLLLIFHFYPFYTFLKTDIWPWLKQSSLLYTRVFLFFSSLV